MQCKASSCLLCLFLFLLCASCGYAWDIRQHLETKTPYWTQQNASTYTPPPSSCRGPIHLNLVARHGTRQPESKDVKLLNQLQVNIQLYKAAITNPGKIVNSESFLLTSISSPMDVLLEKSIPSARFWIFGLSRRNGTLQSSQKLPEPLSIPI